MIRMLDVLTSFVASGVRLTNGVQVANVGPRPEQPLVLYEFEGCPYCRKVREALTMLDLEAEIRPCPKGGARFRGEASAKGGKAQFPYLVDPNTHLAMYESNDIITYLYKQYGTRKPRVFAWTGLMTMLTGVLVSLLRGPGGAFARKSRAPVKPLELYSSEGSPYCRIVRETLCQLELPYLLHNVGYDSARRPAFVARSGRQMIPYLVDPNTDVAMFESAEIKAYLIRTYGA
jgi:glutathione S-transferase